MTSRARNVVGNMLLLVGTLVVFFGGIELALRLTGIDRGLPKTPPIYEKSADPAVSYELKPNLHEQAFRSTVITDRRGFRSPEIQPGKSTIVLLGDSITFGYGIENDQTVGARLNALLGEKYNVVTAAAPGYDLKQEAAFYGDKVAQLHASTLVLIFYWNDLTTQPPDILDDEGNLHVYDWTPESQQCAPIETGILGWLPGRCWLDLHSAFYRTIKKIIIARTEQQNATNQVTEHTENAFGDDASDAQIAAYGETLAAFSKTLPKEQKKLFIIWPERTLHLLSTPTLTALAQKEGFSVLNLYDVFGNRGESLSWDTVHPSAKTADEAAAVIKGWLEQWKLLPQ